MTARNCFRGKITAGQAPKGAGEQLLDMVDAFEAEHQARLGDDAGARQAALDAAALKRAEAARKADDARRALIAQSNVERAVAAYAEKIDELRATPGDIGFGNKAPPGLGKNQTPLGFAVRSLLARDPWEIATWGNAAQLATTIRARAHAQFAEAIEYLRPKVLGFKREATHEIDVLRALYGRTDVPVEARAAAESFVKVADDLADQFIAAGGRLAKRARWRLPNPEFDPAKVRAFGLDRFKHFIRDRLDRNEMLDWDTGQPLADWKFEELLDQAVRAIMADGAEGVPSSAFRGRRMLANERDASRFFVWRDAEAWHAVAEGFGSHASPFETLTGHIGSMANDIAMLRVFGPNPEATKRYILGLFDREAERLSAAAPSESGKDLRAAAVGNRRAEFRVSIERRTFEDAWAEVSGQNRVPVSTALAQRSADVRHLLSAAQLGSAIISSFTDPALAVMTARFNGIPAMAMIRRAIGMMAERGSEVFASQQGVVMDSLARLAGENDRFMGEAIRTGWAARLASGNIRASGLRRWTAILRAAYQLETMALAARERSKAFGELDHVFRGSLTRYGIGAAEWDLIRSVPPHEPRPNAVFLRAIDVVDGAPPAHRLAGEKFARLMNTEVDYAVIDTDPVTGALLTGAARPGTIGGETRRSLAMYKRFPATFVTMHFARAFARGWDGSRLAHGALTLIAMTGFGALAMQSKEIIAGRDPLSLDPADPHGLRAWGKAMFQGGGLGIFGDMLFLDQTRFGNTWAATIAGPVAGAGETLLGDFLMKNIQLTSRGEQTHFAGDALYAASRYLPGSSLWFSRLAFQRAIVDQLALMVDDRARKRFARTERRAKKEFGQRYWWRPGRQLPRRAPDLSMELFAP